MKLSEKYASPPAHRLQSQPGDGRRARRHRARDQQQARATGPELKNGDELQTTETPNLSDVIKSSQGTIEQLNTILAKVDSLADSLNSGKGSIGKLIQDPELYNRANDAVTADSEAGR
jgi:ABC-type transporter Mla subunit MlaD